MVMDGGAEVVDLAAGEVSRSFHRGNPARIDVDHAVFDWRASQRQYDA